MPVSIISVGIDTLFYLSLFAFQGHHLSTGPGTRRVAALSLATPFMRRTQTRHQPRPSIALAADDIGVLREGNETNEDVLRRQLLEKDRENDKVLVVVHMK